MRDKMISLESNEVAPERIVAIRETKDYKDTYYYYGHTTECKREYK